MNIYDFDKTIYAKDSTIEFYKYCFKRYPKIKYCIPKQILGLVFYIVNLYSKKQFKESFLSFLRNVPDVNTAVGEFWNIEENNICKWYIEKKRESDIIISASPEFLILPVARRIGVLNVIATKVDEASGKFLSENCYGEEKLRRLKENKALAVEGVQEFYSDSYSDKPLADIAHSPYIVRKGQIEKWPEKSPENKNLLEIIRYAFWGGVTTALNLILFILFIYIGIPYLVSNVSTYFIAVLASYFLNKKFVFNKKGQVKGESIWEIIKYFAVRLLSVAVDSGLLWICVDALLWNILISKFIVSALIIIMTYILNKLFVFKKDGRD